MTELPDVACPMPGCTATSQDMASHMADYHSDGATDWPAFARALIGDTAKPGAPTECPSHHEYCAGIGHPAAAPPRPGVPRGWLIEHVDDHHANAPVDGCTFCPVGGGDGDAPTNAEREAWLKRPGPITGDEVLRFAPKADLPGQGACPGCGGSCLHPDLHGYETRKLAPGGGWS